MPGYVYPPLGKPHDSLRSRKDSESLYKPSSENWDGGASGYAYGVSLRWQGGRGWGQLPTVGEVGVVLLTSWEGGDVVD